MLSNFIHGAFYCPLTKTIDVGEYFHIYSKYTAEAGLNPYAVLGHMARDNGSKEEFNLRILIPFTDSADSPGYWAYCTESYLIDRHGEAVAVEIINTLKTLLLIG